MLPVIYFLALAFCVLFPVNQVINNFTWQNQRLAEIQRKGCTVALKNIVCYFGTELPQKIPQLWSMIIDPFSSATTSPSSASQTPEEAQEAVNWLQLLEVVIPSLHTDLVSQVWPSYCTILDSGNACVKEKIYLAGQKSKTLCVLCYGDCLGHPLGSLHR